MREQVRHECDLNKRFNNIEHYFFSLLVDYCFFLSRRHYFFVGNIFQKGSGYRYFSNGNFSCLNCGHSMCYCLYGTENLSKIS